jgi:integrase
VLSDAELAAVWRGAIAAGYPFGPFVQLLILTGQRREEVAALQWSELDQERALWTLPAQRAKNGVVHDIPLSGQSLDVLNAIARRISGSDQAIWPQVGYVFSMTGAKPVTGYSAAKKRLDKLTMDAAERQPPEPGTSGSKAPTAWRFHDLRRTLATGLQRLGVRFEVTEAVMNHVSGARSGIAGVYQRHNWSDEKRAALDAWSAHVASIVMPAQRLDV